MVEKLTPGQLWIQGLEDAGETDETIAQLRDERIKVLRENNFTQKAIDDYFGDHPQEPPKATVGILRDNIQKANLDPAALPMADPNSPWEIFKTGFENSVLSLEYTGLPSKQLPPPEQMGWFNSFLSAGGQFLGDFPSGFSSSVGVTAATKNPLAGYYAFGAVPEALRQAMYRDGGHIDLMSALQGLTTYESVTAGAANVVGGKVGQAVAGQAAKVAGPVVTNAAENFSNAIAGTAAISAFQGRLPTKDDFITALLMTSAWPVLSHMGDGASTLVKVIGERNRVQPTVEGEQIVNRLGKIWAKTGVDPQVAAQAASQDAALAQDLVAPDADGEPITNGFKQWAPAEPPKPIKAEVIGGMKPEDIPAKDLPQFEATGEPNSKSGISHVKKIEPGHLKGLTEAISTNTANERLNTAEPDFNDLAKKYKNEDGSMDLEAALIDYHAGEAYAQVYRTSGRNHEYLPVRTQRFLEDVGVLLDQENGYAPETATGGGDGGGEEPPKGDRGLPAGSEPAGPGAGKQARLEGPEAERFKRSWEFATEDYKARVHVPTKGRDWGSIWRATKAAWRELSPAKMVDQMAEKASGKKMTMADIGVEDMWRKIYASDGAASVRILEGGYDFVPDQNSPSGQGKFTVNRKVPSQKSIWKRAEKLKGGIDGVATYFHMLDTLDRINLGLKTRLSADEVNKFLDDLPKADRAKYDELFRDYQTSMKDSLKAAVIHNMLSQEQVDRMLEKHPNYFPQIVAKKPQEDSPFLKKKTTGLFKKAEGHKYDLEDPVFATTKLLGLRERAYKVNMARLATARTLMKIFGGEVKVHNPHLAKIADGKLKLTFRGKIEDAVLTAHEADASPQANIGGDPHFFDHNENIITFYENGVMKRYEVPDFPGRKQVMQMIAGSNTVLEDSFITHFLRSIASVTRTGVTDSLNFIVRVGLQDSFQTAAASKYGGKPVANIVGGAMDILDAVVNEGKAGKVGKGREKVIEFILNGGYGASLADMDAHGILENYHRLQSTGVVGSAANFVRHPLEGLRKFTRSLDAATRVGGVYTNAAPMIGAQAAARESRIVNGDMAERSASPIINWFASVTPFFNAMLRGKGDALAHALQTDPLGFGVRLGYQAVFYSLSSIALGYGMQQLYEKEIGAIPEDAKLENVPLYQRSTHYLIPFVDSEGNFSWMRLPVAFDMGSTVHGTVTYLMSQWADEDPETFKEYMSALWGKWSSTVIPGVNNPAVDFMIDVTTNYDMGTGKNVIPGYLEGRSAYLQYYPWTSTQAKTISDLIGPRYAGAANVSPITIDKFISTFGGTTGADIWRLIDKGMRPDVDNLPTDWANHPFIGGFFLRHQGMSALPIQRFEQRYKDWSKLKKDYQYAKNHGDEDEMERLGEKLEEYPVDMKGAHKAITTAYNMIDAISSDPDITDPQDRRQLTDQIVTEAIQGTKDALQQLYSAGF